ncbi:poly-gamma-glutamate hydrolase family protein [Streptomyces anandii]|uniref:poly-gamma-glutamate hydrolase family protein n=1 Tax=Streptomyces anandii TaxID=285454 RepID=UPI0036CD4CA5
MADLYANFAELAAATTEGVDWRLDISKKTSKNISIAIHGGGIEIGTTELALAVAARCRHNFYSFDGLRSSNNSELHITSTNFDEPNCVKMVTASDYCFSFHGMSDITAGVAQTYVGGLDTVNRDAVIAALTGAGFLATTGTSELDGSSTSNITNRTTRAMGVQLELSSQQRKNFFTGGDWSRSNRETGVRTEEFYRYVKAVSSVANQFGGGVSQTSNYNLNLATDNDSMADYETWINYNWEPLRKAASPQFQGTTLPQSGPFNIGDRFYKTDTKSIYILVCKDPNWGWFWRPIQDAISPWITPPDSCMNVSDWTLSPVAGKPFQIAYDNRGKCYWRGIIGPSSGGIVRNTVINVFKPLPDGLRPRQRGVYLLGYEPINVGTDGTNLTCYEGARIYLSDNANTTPTVRTFGGTADPTRVHLTGVNYAVGTGKYWTP